MAFRDNILMHEHAVLGVVVVTVIGGAVLLGIQIGFQLGMARCVP